MAASVSTHSHLRRQLMTGALLSLAGGAIIWKATRREAPLPSAGEIAIPKKLGAATLVSDTQAIPDFRAVGPAGEFNRSRLAGRWTLVFFGYTQCPDVCPTTLGMLATAFGQLAKESQPAVLFISVDPQRDTAALLSQYLPAFHPDFQGAAAQDQDISALVKHLGVFYQRHTPDARGQYTVDHSASMFLINPQSQLAAVFSPPHDDAAQVAQSLKALCVPKA